MSGIAALPPGSRLCAIDDIPDPGSRAWVVQAADGPAGIVVVRHGGLVRAWRNRCPHTGAPLDWLPGQVLDPGGTYIQCALHGALFRIADGLCLRGPCVGESLSPVSVAVRDGAVWWP